MRIPINVVGAAAFVVVVSIGLVAAAASRVAMAQEVTQPSLGPLEIPANMNEYSINPRHLAVRAGQPVQFIVTNTGAERHRFNVVGFGERWRAEQDQPGETAVVNATFTQPGVYLLYCSSVTDVRHREAGSVGTLTVVEEGQDAALRVPVTLGSYWFQPLGQVAVAGQPTRFELTNVSDRTHSFVIAGRGQEWSSPTVRPGAPVSWDVTIDTPGIYEVYCAFTTPEPHRDLGMIGVLEVLPSGASMTMPGP